LRITDSSGLPEDLEGGPITARDAHLFAPGEWINNFILTEFGVLLQDRVDPDQFRVLPALFYQHLISGSEVSAAHWM
jgi:hypothetical protein